MNIVRNWHLLDAKSESLGRLSSKIAKLLMGKNKATYTANLDCGDFVVVVNSDEIKFTGNKLDQKVYSRHSGIPGGYREETAGNLIVRDSRKVLQHAVSGMLPKNKLQQPRLMRLKIYKGADHPHANHFAKGDK